MTAIAAVPTGSASHGTYSDEQFIAVGTGPLWYEQAHAAITQQAECDPSSDLQGIDGYWYDLEAEGIGVGDAHDFLVTTDDPMDVDVLFYDDSCGLVHVVGNCFISTGLGDNDPLGDCQEESGPVPEQAAYVLVQNFLGSGTYQLTIS